MERKKEGYALVFTLVVIMMLLVLGAAVASLSTASYMNSVRLERNNKLKLAAESGIDRAKVALKSYIKDNPDVIVNPQNFIPSNVNVEDITENGITTKVSFLPSNATDTISDNLTGRNINYIKIHSVARDISTNYTKTVDAIIDKGSVSNVYFDRLFKSSFTVAHKTGDSSVNSFIAYNNTNVYMAGNMFIQTNNLSFQPGSYGTDEGDIYVKSDNINLNFINTTLKDYSGRTINKYKNNETSEVSGWQSIPIKSLNLLGIYDPTQSNAADDIQNFTNVNGNEVIDKNNNLIKWQTYKDAQGKEHATLVTYKARSSDKNNIKINFQNIVNGSDKSGVKDGIYNNIITKLRTDTTILDPVNYYGHIYKLILIDGDLDIDDDPGESFNNYVIYCTGKVKFKGNCYFYNSSIFANSVEFPDNNTNKYNAVFYGVGTQMAFSHIIGGENLVDFSDFDKATINRYLVCNLENYGDFMQFKTLSWNEY